MSHENEADNPANNTAPFQIEVADRVKRLPPYLFARSTRSSIRSGAPATTSSTWAWAIPPIRPRTWSSRSWPRRPATRATTATARRTGIPNLRREVAGKYLKKYGVRLDPESETIVCLGSKEGFSHMCLALMGPGDTAIVPAPYFPVHVYAVALAAANVHRAGSGRQREVPVEHRLHLPASVSQAEAADRQLSAQSVGGDGRAGVLTSTWSSWRGATASW